MVVVELTVLAFVPSLSRGHHFVWASQCSILLELHVNPSYGHVKCNEVNSNISG